MNSNAPATVEARRLAEDARRERNWKRWGPYLAERQWATVREDYSAHGTCWNYFPHDHARSRAYRWGEDGLLGITDRECRLCFALALWNGRDPILKERLFGLTGPEGNHGEDVKEEYFYLDSTPTHSYMRALYKYPQAEFPYEQLVKENRRRSKDQPELELADTGIFSESRYFDVFGEYAKRSPDDLLIRITVVNRGPEAATLHLLPALWFRNTWAWGCSHEGCSLKPRIRVEKAGRLLLNHESLHEWVFEFEPEFDGEPLPVFFTENETNTARLFGVDNDQPFVKDAFHERVVHGRGEAVNPEGFGTKAALHYVMNLAAGEERSFLFRLCPKAEAEALSSQQMKADFSLRMQEADEYYKSVCSESLPPAERGVVLQGFAGLLWSKQFYHYVIEDWLKGDPHAPPPPRERLQGRNHEWRHIYARGVLSMPDKWEYPWFAAWDLAFHMIPFAHVDPAFAKEQLVLMLREWYMHPNGQIPAYEFAFDDVNPPVHAWAAWRVYKIAANHPDERDRAFLESVFQKLLLNFTWWVNRKDEHGKNLFSGGFLGFDNIGVFDRSKPLPTGGTLQQADGTAWMAFYCGTMLSMALELARGNGKINPAYEDMASKFFEHYIQITDAMNHLGGTGLWNEADGFYYDQIQTDHEVIPLRTRSLVGLLPLIAVEVLEDRVIDQLPGFRKRLNWFMKNRRDLSRHITYCQGRSGRGHRLLAIPSRQRLTRVLRFMLDENEFLSPYGIRSVSKFHKDHPYIFSAGGVEHQVSYEPGESVSGLFGGNSNWRGPVWLPINYLLVEALERYHHFYGDELKVEFPTGSGHRKNLKEVAMEIASRLVRIFLPDASGQRPCNGGDRRFRDDPHWKEWVLFHEYFHGETGKGLGASHQTGWTALVIRLIKDLSKNGRISASGN